MTKRLAAVGCAAALLIGTAARSQRAVAQVDAQSAAAVQPAAQHGDGDKGEERTAQVETNGVTDIQQKASHYERVTDVSLDETSITRH